MPRGGAKPGERRGGRKKGTPNKFSGDVRQMILSALAAAGGAEYLKEQAGKNPGAFMGLVGKTLPKDIKIDASISLADLIAQARGQRTDSA